MVSSIDRAPVGEKGRASGMTGAAPGSGHRDAFGEAVATVQEANRRGLPLKLLGGQAVRLLCPQFPHRTRSGQDMDFASVSSAQHAVMSFFGELGFVGDQRFNLLHGHRQMFFRTADGSASIDVVVDELHMCHVLNFRNRIDRMPYTLDVTDLLLTKLQIVELNRKDIHDIVHLLSAYEIREDEEPAGVSLPRIGEIVGQDWGWWRTVTGNLIRIRELIGGELRSLIPEARGFEPSEQLGRLHAFCQQTPKSLKWKIRSRVGERVQWYELPEEPQH